MTKDDEKVVGGAAAVAMLAVGAVISYFLWPVAAPAAVVMTKAPGAAGFLISRAAFLANPKLYFALLRTAGAAAAAAAFAA
ncbi:hypothetical protein C2845_PM03G12400 [Panicum miliaceum]|uniref:Uncharacterized protein n=1 Tax=Panicum miliaceum TaxID=4540 RepID=A0A3L6T6S0_PANMI|nr:hypothetical protein C2845_PM03G12400 [Panicum miliaceum]